MPAKAIQTSADGVTWYTLPGTGGEYSDEGEQLNDTILGQSYSSIQPGLIGWTLGGQAFYKGFAGYVATLKQGGTPVALSAEAMSLVSGKTYQITSATKRLINHLVAVTVLDNAVAVDAADIETIDYVNGRVTFDSAYTPTGSITITGEYVPLADLAKAQSFTLTQNAEAIDETDLATAKANGGYRVFRPGLRTVSLEVGGFYDEASALWEVLDAREDIIIEINPDGAGLSRARGIFKMVSRSQSGDVGALEEETRQFQLSVPENVDLPFSWLHDASTTLSQAVRVLLDAFTAETLPYVRYAPDGILDTYFQGQGVVTDLSLSGGVDAMNEFTVSIQGSDAPTRVSL